MVSTCGFCFVCLDDFGQLLPKKRSQNVKEGVILNLFQDLIGPIAIDWRFRNKFGMTQRGVEIVS